MGYVKRYFIPVVLAVVVVYALGVFWKTPNEMRKH
jgi:uncharacterized membrane protein (Fun14 family)